MADGVLLRLIAKELQTHGGRLQHAGMGTALDDLLLEWGRTAVAQLREATPVEESDPLQRGHPPPGTARNAWRTEPELAHKRMTVLNTTSYLRYHVTGTPQDDPGAYIYPNVAPMLVFYAKEGPFAGHKIARYRVHGIQPNPHLVDAIDRSMAQAIDMFKEKGVEVSVKLMGLVG